MVNKKLIIGFKNQHSYFSWLAEEEKAWSFKQFSDLTELV